jgi:hypothetical protein
MAEMTRDRLACLTDDELLVYQRDHHGDPYITLAKAKEMQRVALQFWHVGAAKKKADREAQEESRRRLHDKLFRARSHNSSVEAPTSGRVSPFLGSARHSWPLHAVITSSQRCKSRRRPAATDTD